MFVSLGINSTLKNNDKQISNSKQRSACWSSQGWGVLMSATYFEMFQI